MSLFELQRLGECWQEAQVFHDLVSAAASTDNRGGHEERAPSGASWLWSIPCHLFACCSPGPGQWDLFVLNHFPVGVAKGSHDTSSEPLLSCSTSPVIAVLPLPPHTVLVVTSDGCIRQFTYNPDTFTWLEGPEGLVRVKGEVCDAVLCQGDTSVQLVWRETSNCEEEESDNNTKRSVCASTVSLGDKMVVYDHRQLISSAPCVSMHSVGVGVWLIPHPGPPNLFFYWQLGADHVIPYVFNSPRRIVPLSSSITDYCTLVLRSAAVWTKSSSTSSVLSVTPHSSTGRLLTLSSDGTVHTLQYTPDTGVFSTEVLTTLLQFTLSYPSPSPSLHLFTLHTYTGVFTRGEIRLYDTCSGEFVWECSDHEDSRMQLLTTPTNQSSPTHPIMYGPGGFFILRSKRIIDHAQFLSDVLFPSDDDQTAAADSSPCDNGHLLATILCQYWGLPLPATHYTIETAHHILATDSLTDPYSPLIQQMPDFLRKLSVQNPVLATALMIKHPSLSGVMRDHLGSFLERCRDDTTGQLLSQTPLNTETIPLLSQLLALSNEYHTVLHATSHQPRPLPSSSAHVCQLLDSSQQISLDTHQSTAELRADIISQCYTDPDQALTGIKQFIGVTDTFSEAVEAIQCGKWTSRHSNWRSLLAPERPEKLNTTSQPQVVTSSSSSALPLFDIVSQLIYKECPHELSHFVKFAQLVHDYQPSPSASELGVDQEYDFFRKCRKGYYQERAINTLPPPVPPSPPNQVLGYCHLLLLSDQTQSELRAITLLLDHQMWDEAVTLLRQTLPRVTPTHQCALFHRTLLKMAASNVLSSFLPSLWELLPNNFSVINFLDVLKVTTESSIDTAQCYPTLKSDADDSIAVSDVTNHILELLAKQCPV